MNNAGVELLCPAKINLGLRVVRKREDGYHDLETVFQRVTLFDRLRVERAPSEGVRLACPDSDLPENGKNLVWRAAEAFLNRVGAERGVFITLWKTIPVSAGLGGGSSDAASALLALNELFGNPLSHADLSNLGVSLGADVPFFIMETSTALGEGIGDRLTTVTLPRMWFVLAHPAFEVSTAMIYGALDLRLTRAGWDVKEALLNQSSFKIENLLYNDLETVTVKVRPEIDAIREALVCAGATRALMSGSGPTVFGLFPGREAAVGASRYLTANHGLKTSIVRSF